MDPGPLPSEEDHPPPPFKKRKVFRRRPRSEDEEDDNHENPSPPTATAPKPVTLDELITQSSYNGESHVSNEQEPPLSMAEILRQRKAMQRRGGGVAFRNDIIAAKDGLAVVKAKAPLLAEDDTLNKIMTVVDRFAPQTGQVENVDEHMMAYIDSELAKRRYMQTTASQSSLGADGVGTGSTIDAVVQRQPAALGKLQEVDLGPGAASLNAARTEAAKRRLEGGDVEPDEPAGRIRLGKDGKPRKPRRRRNSDDVKRDKLVEDVLRESKLDIYDEPEIELPNDDQAADDRIAEQFRREFMDAISQRQQKKAQPTKKPGPGTVDDKMKGPKLGGSRSARAAMRELQEKAVKK